MTSVESTKKTAGVALTLALTLLLAAPATAQQQPPYAKGQARMVGNVCVIDPPTVSVLNRTNGADSQTVVYWPMLRPVRFDGQQLRPSGPAIEGVPLCTAVGEPGTGYPAATTQFVHKETGQPISRHEIPSPAPRTTP